jgi:hypothetical protein
LSTATHSGGSIPQALQSVLSTFGDITGWAADDPNGLHGNLSVLLK